MDRTDLTVIKGDARVADHRLAEVLGFSRTRDLHRLIRSSSDELEDFGEVFANESKNPSPRGGRPIKTYYLNEHQAVLISMKAETAKARSGRKLIAEVFIAWRRGELPAILAPTVDPFAAMAGRTGYVRDQLAAIAAMPDFAREVTHLPIWKNGRRPDWWGNYDLRTFLTESHRQMTLAACCAEVKRRFNRPFSTTTLQRYWALLDQAIGPKTKKEAA